MNKIISTVEKSKKPKVLVAMSGGVDSSVAAALLIDAGYDVVGATMQVWDYSSCDIEEGHGTCCSSLDVDDARSVADKLGIPFYVLNCESKFRDKVIDPFLKSYLEGKTPLPCVDCNTFLKFDHLIQKMKELECDFLATGHYAQVLTDESGKPAIYTSTDDWKDQTYFLFTLDPEIVPHLIFPIGHLKKPEVRSIAEAKGLSVAKKKDSTGICFVGDKGYSQFIESQVSADVLKSKAGLIRRLSSGEIMGEHGGIHLFTYGQSKGIGLSHHEKLFVIKIDPITNTVWVGDEKDLYAQQVEIVDTHWLTDWNEEDEYQVKIRYQHKPARAKIKKQEDRLIIEFFDSQKAITPGQAAVIYKNQKLMGGGWITL